MSRATTVFTCSQCGRREAKWLGHCPDCGAWDSFVEEALTEVTPRGRARSGKAQGGGGSAAAPLRLAAVASSATERFSTGIDELDRVLGGGIVPGSLVLVGGEPGIGKSTLLLQVLDKVAGAGRSTLLVCGEESAAQVKMRAERVCAASDDIAVLAETQLETVIESVAAAHPALVVVDSVQTLYSDGFTSAPGSVSQVREAAGAFLRLAKATGTVVILIGHVTKEGAIAGPRVLEHMVDTTLQFEGDRHRFYRTLRATKNRFGSTDELGIFEMTGSGLVPVADPSRLFLDGAGPSAGAVVHIAVEGTRCFPVEVQALVSRSEMAVPRRVTNGFDRNRLAMIIAVLTRHARLPLSSHDVFVTIAGGIRIDEPAADLAVALAIASAECDVPLSPRVAVFGEISLTGRLRPCSQSERRVGEATRVGFARVVAPVSGAAAQGDQRVSGADDLRAAMALAFDPTPARRGHIAASDDKGV
ncbi:MAG TPA: DNA repair protein RadA [Thermoleophilia bacterium]|nr:DNA repair protein RadA [Thermoleophilia bacterium]HQG03940.1 DNA repair protein RadA [Thermoleophilia bacterium]HQG54619.1 DNA repair protein RadA [Thermoleophilia bacterium]